MAIISSFMCWSNTRTGSAVCGYYTLVISVVCLAFYMLRYIALDEMKDSIELKGIVYAGFVLYSFLIGVSLILLPGVYMDRKFFLLPWIYVLVITILYETGAIALITTVHLEQDHTLNTWEIVAVVFYCLRLVANCYCFACVVSQYQELSEGRGTYEFLFKPRRRRHMARGAPMTDIDEYHPPYGVPLPPYSEENPYKQFSPPNYENLGTNFREIESPSSWRYNSPRILSTSASTSCLADIVVNPCPSGCQDIEVDDDGEGYLDHFHHQGYIYSDNNHHHHHHQQQQQQQVNSCLNEVHSPRDSHHHCHRHSCHERAPSYASEADGRFQSDLEMNSEMKFCPHSREVSQEIHPPNVAMTESSGSFLQTSPSPSSTHSHSRSHSRSHSCSHSRSHSSPSPSLLPSHLRGQRPPPAIQKRTYITWI